jgi:catechol 2,3-dioxygenase-like lactoylglutathione lyase family enzyme
MNLNQVTVAVNEIAPAVAFYRGLGLRLIVLSPHYARFECPNGEATFSVH